MELGLFLQPNGLLDSLNYSPDVPRLFITTPERVLGTLETVWIRHRTPIPHSTLA